MKIYVVLLTDKYCNLSVHRAFENKKEAEIYAEEQHRYFEYDTKIEEVDLYHKGDYYSEIYL